MTTLPATQAAGNRAISETRFSASTRRILALLGDRLTGEHPFNADWASDGIESGELRLAADEHRALMERAEAEIIAKTLAGLRSATIPREETPAEASASFNLLRVHLADVPIDILQEACRRYVNQPGRRFFPRSAGEVRTFASPLMLARAMREDRLRRMADAAAEREERARKEAEFTWTADHVRQLPRSIAADGVTRGWYGQEIFDAAFPPVEASEGEGA